MSVRARISEAAEKSGRSGDSVRLVAVTKTWPVETVQAVVNQGLTWIGENRVQEAAAKKENLSGVEKLHLIGQLQRNKARKALELFDLIQTVDSPKLAEALDRIAGEMGIKAPCLVEVKISDEASKSGLPWAEASGFLQNFKIHSHLSLKGLMAVGPLNATSEELRVLYRRFFEYFRGHADCFGENPILSLGMSDDFEVAIEEGSNLVRLGRVLFGERN